MTVKRKTQYPNWRWWVVLIPALLCVPFIVFQQVARGLGWVFGLIAESLSMIENDIDQVGKRYLAVLYKFVYAEKIDEKVI